MTCKHGNVAAECWHLWCSTWPEDVETRRPPRAKTPSDFGYERIHDLEEDEYGRLYDEMWAVLVPYKGGWFATLNGEAILPTDQDRTIDGDWFDLAGAVGGIERAAAARVAPKGGEWK